MDLRGSTSRVLGMEMAEGGLRRRRRRRDITNDLTDIVFSWSLHDIFNENLYQNQVETIPVTFQSVQHYLGSYVYPLLEETRASLCSSLEHIYWLPFTEVTEFVKCMRSGKSYAVKASGWRNESNIHGKETYRTLPGDILILTDAKPATVSDLERFGRRWVFASVRMMGGDEEADEATSCTNFKVEALLNDEVNNSWKPMWAIFLINIATNKRIWNVLHMSLNLDIVKEVLCTDLVDDKVSNLCITTCNGSGIDSLDERLCHDLNESQKNAVGACLDKLRCETKPSIELIWGPPGTGKTKTVATLLFTLLKRKHRTIVCAPTNVAIKEVASRVLKLLKESDSGLSIETESSLCYLGDMLIFGNKERLKVDSDIEEIYLENRADCVAEYFSKVTGWHRCLTSMIDILEDCVRQYHIFLENEHTKRRKPVSDGDGNESGSGEEDGNRERKSFLDFFRDQIKATFQPLRRCLYIFCTHISRTNFQNIASLLTLLDSFEALLCGETLDSEMMEKILSCDGLSLETSVGPLYDLYMKRQECLSMLRTVCDSLKDLKLPNFTSKAMISDFCYQHASLIFCTASSSYKLYSVQMEPLNLLVIDEAAQLKECESVIPLQLPGVKHLILVGDECQLPAMVDSKVSGGARFGRSLFERLSSLGYSRQLLNIQYRMHPSISLFPTSNFYQNQILDGPNVKNESYRKTYLSWPMFGPYSFINITDTREEVGDDGYSLRNPVEVEVVSRILRNLYRAWDGSEDLTVGVISPYAAQVAAVQAKLGKKYENIRGFMVKVKSVDGFQGGEEDIVIISTVKSNSCGNVGFLSNTKRTNVALTRARYCLWILGNEKTLTKSKSVWETLVDDAKSRGCFFNVDDDKDLAKAILDVKKEYNQLDDLLDRSSVLFRNARWKVLFSDDFLKSFKKLASLGTKMSIINLLSNLSSGWRPKKGNVDIICEHSSYIVRQFKAGGLYVLCTIDIVKEELIYSQILKVWDVLPLEDVTKLVKRLDSIFKTYRDDFISRCSEKCIEGDQEVPKTWISPFEFVRYRSAIKDQRGSSSDADASDHMVYAENAKVRESLHLMKFYPLSSDVMSHLFNESDSNEVSLPFEVTEQEQEIILCPRSTFILGRSGTGKTTVLTMKLLSNEKRHYEATKGSQEIQSGIDLSKDALEFNAEEIMEGAEECFLRQLFVTVGAELCFAVKQHVSQLRSSCIGARHKVENSSVDQIVDDGELFKDIPDSFADVSPNSFPLIITFRKLLMMLDGTAEVSFFERFPDLREFCHCQSYNSRPLSLQSLLRTKEVTYEKFCADYWPRFNDKIRRRLNPSRVFTEIMSHIKGGLQPADCCDGKLNRLAYISLSEGRVSTLSIQRREEIYDAFEDYEKMKMKNGEFDLADLVNDLHRRLSHEHFSGNLVDFVYIDEVQDLTMRQISLFKYICRNVDEGFVFSGDTAQTIARGIDFRFEDIRSLFYKEFLMDSMDGPDNRMEKGCLSKTFHLSENFRTHAGILKLAQSVVDLLYHFFPSSIDALSPETSFICGEAPIWLESESEESAILSIFRNHDVSGNFVGFGAEQVILVRDDCSRNEVSSLVRGQALVLTIVECKGLEFQDVLLYNFFGTSPLKSQWRVIYGYMREQALLDNSSQWSSPNFDDTKHNILCSELKQLYVAITRTRQRLWICENGLESYKPMFDYWKKECLIQVRLVDHALAEAMPVRSTPEEWKSQGFKLLQDRNYPMAIMCFERAKYTYGEKLAKASAFKADADLKHSSHPREASVLRRQAAEIYETIGMAESAAECFYMVKEYERAGRIYMDKCGESALKKAGESFSLAGRYTLAAEAYARANIFSKCLSICAEGKLFEVGLQYIEDWKRQGNENSGTIKKRTEIEKLEQDFLESCALHYHELRDYREMMKYVKAFQCIDSMRYLLKRLGCLDELISLEEDFGNFSEAAKIVRMKGDLLREVDLLGKCGQNREASMNILWYILFYSLWAPGSKGWPLKQFAQEEELVAKAEHLAKPETTAFHEFVSVESSILLNKQNSLVEMKEHLSASSSNGSVRGEIICARNILDFHLRRHISKFCWEYDWLVDPMKYSEQLILRNQISVDSLVCFWNLWRENIVRITKCMEMPAEKENTCYWEFCLNYFGVLEQRNNMQRTYHLLNPDADWVRNIEKRFLRRNGQLVSLELKQLVSAARKYWHSELTSVGMEVLHKLDALYQFLVKGSRLNFWQSKCLAILHEVAKFLGELDCLNYSFQYGRALEGFIKKASGRYFDHIFPLDWRRSSTENMTSLRGSEASCNLLRETMNLIISKKHFSYGKMGEFATLILGSGVLDNQSYKKAMQSLKENASWKAFMDCVYRDVQSDIPETSNDNEESMEFSLAWNLYQALADTYNANWRMARDYITPICFTYLLERLLILLSCSKRQFYATKSSLVEWVICHEGLAKPSFSFDLGNNMEPIIQFVTSTIAQLLHNKGDTREWIKKSNLNVTEYYPLFILKLVLLVCLLHLNFDISPYFIIDLLSKSWISEQLPPEFRRTLSRCRRPNLQKIPVGVLAEAFGKVNDPLVMANSAADCSNRPHAVILDVKLNKCKQEIIKVLFP